MTIKQQGGIFGRNPTFNDVVVNDISASKVTTSEIAHSDLAITGVGEVKINGTIAGAGSSKLQVTQDSGVADWTGIFQADTTTGLSYGLAVRAGTNASDYGFLVRNAANTQTLVAVTGDGNLVIGTAGSGIDFSATSGTGTSELFDDYEEGTWTPTIVGTTTAGSGTYSYQVGYYTKVGNLVTAQAYVEWTGHTGTGNMRLGGLPFTTSSSSLAFSAVTFGFTSNIALTSGNHLQGYTLTNSTEAVLYQVAIAGGSPAAVPIDTAGGLIYTVSYRSA